MRPEGVSHVFEQRNRGELFASGAFCNFCLFQEATSSHSCKLLPRVQSAENIEPALCGSLQHWPPTHPSSSLRMARCLSLCAGKCAEIHGKSAKVKGGPLRELAPYGPWSRAMLVTTCAFGYQLSFEAQSPNHRPTWVSHGPCHPLASLPHV